MRVALVDAEVVGRRLREIGRRLAELRDIRSHSENVFLTDTALQAQAERHLQLALQCAIDIALHILADDTDQTPEDYGSAFRELATAGILDRELADRLRLAAGLRNILVHAYLDVDPARIWTHLSRLNDLEDFARAVDAYLEQPPRLVADR